MIQKARIQCLVIAAIFIIAIAYKIQLAIDEVAQIGWVVRQVVVLKEPYKVVKVQDHSVVLKEKTRTKNKWNPPDLSVKQNGTIIPELAFCSSIKNAFVGCHGGKDRVEKDVVLNFLCISMAAV